MGHILTLIFIPLLIWFLYREFGVGKRGDQERTVRIGHMGKTSPSGAFWAFAIFFGFVFLMALIGLCMK